MATPARSLFSFRFQSSLRSGSPEKATSKTPAPLRDRAILRATTTPRMPDRGGALPFGGVHPILPDRTLGGIPKALAPLLAANRSITNRIIATGGNRVSRGAALKAIHLSTYIERRKETPKGQIMAGLDGRYFAQRARPKPGAPGGIVGAKRDIPTGTAVGSIYATRVSPVPVRENFVSAKIGGSGAARAPVGSISYVSGFNQSVNSAVKKAFVAKAPTVDRVNAAGGTSNLTSTDSFERIALLAGVAVLGYMMIRGR